MTALDQQGPSPEIPERQPLVVVRARRGIRGVELRSIWEFRDLLRTLAVRDLKLRYRQTALGVAWVILQPLLAAGVLSFVFGNVAKLPSDGVPYFIFAFAGMLGWNVFSGTFSKASGSLLANGSMLGKIFFPRLVLPLSAVASVIVDLVVAGIVMGVLIVTNGIPVTARLAFLPIWIIGMIMLGLGVGSVSGALSVSYRDFVHIVPTAVQFLLYASPVAYSLHSVPDRYRTLYSVNPLVGLLQGFRWSLIGGTSPGWSGLYAIAVALVALVVGVVLFGQMARRFADVV